MTERNAHGHSRKRGGAEALRLALSKAADVRIAVAFWGRGASDLFAECPADDVRVICHLESGACNPDEIGKLIHRFPDRVRSHPSLHAKVWRIDRAVMIGSSNASANGLVLEADELGGWEEANLLIDSPDMARSAGEWFDSLWEAPRTRPISATMLAAAEKAWLKRRTDRPLTNVPSSGAEGLLAALRSNPEQFKDRRIFVTSYRWESGVSDEERMAVAEAAEVPFEELDVYEGWHWDDASRTNDLPEPGTQVIDFDMRTKQWGVYRVSDAIRWTRADGLPRVWVLRSEQLNIEDKTFDLAPQSDELRRLIRSTPAARESYLDIYEWALSLKR